MGFLDASQKNSEQQDVMADINTTPLIDVMLVLLIMLIITIPIQLHGVGIQLPVTQSQAPAQVPVVVRLDIDAQGVVHWNGVPLDGPQALDQQLHQAALASPVPELHVRPDRQTAYRVVASVMSAIQREGLTKVGLVGQIS